MVTELTDSTPDNYRYVIQRNQSLSRRGYLLLNAGIVGVLLTVGVLFFAAGYMLVLPFSGIEAVAFVVALNVVYKKGQEKEVVSISSKSIVVERGRFRPEFRDSLPRTWAKLALISPAHRNDPTRLAFTSHGRRLEVGNALTDDEREELAMRLRRALSKTELHPGSGVALT